MRAVNARGSRNKKPPARNGRVAAPVRKDKRAPARGGNAGAGAPPKPGLRALFANLRGIKLIERPMLILTLVLVVFGTIGGIMASGYLNDSFNAVQRSYQGSLSVAGFTVRDISIAGNERTSAEAVRAALGVSVGDSSFALDPSLVRARLMNLPWVADADVRRTLPGSVSVTLIEKHPFARWRDAAGIAIVERSGAVITRENTDGFARLPLMAGPGAPEVAAPLIDALGEQRAVSARLHQVVRVSERRWDLILDGGVTVRLPEEGWETQLSELERLIVDRGVLEHDIEIIDLRYPDKYIFRLHNGDSRPVPRERPA